MSLRCTFDPYPVLKRAFLDHRLDNSEPIKLLRQEQLVGGGGGGGTGGLQLGVGLQETLYVIRGIAICDGFEDCVVNEAVLLVCLDHVVSLLSHAAYKLADIGHAFFSELLEAVVDG